MSPSGKDEADETGVSRLDSLSPLGLRRVWTSSCSSSDPSSHCPIISATCSKVSGQT